jgi:hypothetical protein
MEDDEERGGAPRANEAVTADGASKPSEDEANALLSNLEVASAQNAAGRAKQQGEARKRFLSDSTSYQQNEG